MSSLFSNKVVAVTGAGSGIGRAIALGLARDGATVHLADRDADGLTQTAELIRAEDAGRSQPNSTSRASFRSSDGLSR